MISQAVHVHSQLPYLPECKSQLQHLFLLLISRVRLILRMFRILRSTSRTESKTSPTWAWSRTVVQRMRKIIMQVEYAHDGACMLRSEDCEADELL